MASLELFGFESLDEVFRAIGDIPWDVTDNALQAMAEVEAEKIRQEGRSGGIYDPESNVHILDKIKVNKSEKDDAGGHADVTFSGSRTRSGHRTRNAEIAFVNEYGKREQRARPFVKNAIEKHADAITAPGEKIIGDWIEKTWKET